MSHQLAYFNPSFGVRVQASKNNIQTFARNCFLNVWMYFVLSFLDILLDLMVIASLKW